MCLLAYLAWLVTAGLFGALFALFSGGVDQLGCGQRLGPMKVPDAPENALR